MSASGNKKLAESKEIIHIGNVEHLLFGGGYRGIVNCINEYTGFTSDHSTWFSFFGSTSLKEEILLLAHYAAPLEKVEAYVRKAHEKGEDHLPDTLVQATVKAIQDGDVNLIDDNKNVIYEGMAERLMKLSKDLYENRFAECLEQVRRAIPIESKEQQEERERNNQDAIRRLLNAFKKNDKDTPEEIKAFKAWAKTTSVINRIHLIYLALVELEEKGGLQGDRYGELGTRWCYEVIGGILQRKDLSPRMQQVLAFGVYYVFNHCDYLPNKRELGRVVDFDAAIFIGDREIGVSDYYDELGLDGPGALVTKALSSSDERICSVSKLTTSYYNSIQSLLHPDRALNHRAGVG